MRSEIKSVNMFRNDSRRRGAEGGHVRRSYKFLLRPTSRQEAALRACLEDTRQLYNAALEERREAWRMGRHQVTFSSQDAQLKKIRADDPERYGRWSLTASGPRSGVWTGRSRASSSALKLDTSPATPVQGAGVVGFNRMAGQRRRPLGLDPTPQNHPCLPQGNRARPRPPAPARQGARQDHHCEARG